MERISSGTFVIKKVFPVCFFGLITAFFVTGGVTGAWKQSPMFVIQPLIMVAVGGFLFRKLLWDLADEVLDGGTFLVVRKGSVEERVQLADVMNVDTSQFTNPRRITLRLRKPGKLGKEIVFLPRSTFHINPFARNPVAETLIERIDRLRQHA